MDDAARTSTGQLNEPLLAVENESSPMGHLSQQNGASNGDNEPAQAVEEEHTSEQQPTEHHQEEPPWYQCPLQLTAMLSNYSTSYNVVNISMVIPILEQIFKQSSSEDVAASASSLLAGMIVGQLVGGYLGDSPILGRLGALQLVMSLQVVASIGSSLLWTTHIRREHFYVLLAVFRFLLGMGAGGVCKCEMFFFK
jgi:hypothetical protein